METHPPRFIHSIASLNMSLLKINSMRLFVAFSRVQGRTFLVTMSVFPSTMSTCNIKKYSQWDLARVDTEFQTFQTFETWIVVTDIYITLTSASCSPSTSIRVYFPGWETKFDRSHQLFFVLSLNFFSKSLTARSRLSKGLSLLCPASPWI